MQSAERSTAPLALPGRVIVAAPVDAVVLMISVRRTHGRSEARVRRHSGHVGVLKVARVEAMMMMMMLLQEAVVRDRRHPAVGVPIDMRRRLLVAVAHLPDRSVLGGSPGEERRHHGRMVAVSVKGGEPEGVGQSHGTKSLMRRLTQDRSVRDVRRFLVAVVITVVARLLPLIIVPQLAFDLDAGLRGLGHLDLNPHPVTPVRDGLALDRKIRRRSRRWTRRV